MGNRMTDEQRAKRLHYHMYDTLEGIEDHANRIVALEELCADAMQIVCDRCPAGVCEVTLTDGTINECDYKRRTHELGIEVDR